MSRIKPSDTAVGKMWEQYASKHHEAPESLVVTKDEVIEFHTACLARSVSVMGADSIHSQLMRYRGTQLMRDDGKAWRWNLKHPDACPVCNQLQCKCSFLPCEPPQFETIKLTTLIKLWDELRQASEPLGFCDLEKALEARGVVITNDTEQETNR